VKRALIRPDRRSAGTEPPQDEAAGVAFLDLVGQKLDEVFIDRRIQFYGEPDAGSRPVGRLRKNSVGGNAVKRCEGMIDRPDFGPSRVEFTRELRGVDRSGLLAHPMKHAVHRTVKADIAIVLSRSAEAQDGLI
jgi:hypothetical protein